MWVECVVADLSYFTEGELYQVIDENGGEYNLLDDDGDDTWMDVLNFEESEAPKINYGKKPGWY